MNLFSQRPILFCLWATFAVSAPARAATAEVRCRDFLAETASRLEAAVPRNAPARNDYRSLSGSDYDADSDMEYARGRRDTRGGSRNGAGKGKAQRSDLHSASSQPAALPDLSPLRSKAYRVSSFEGDAFFPNENAYLRSDIHRLEIGSHSFDVIVPKSANLGWATSGVIKTLSELPLARIEALRTVRLNAQASQQDAYWRETYKDFKQAAAAAGDGQIDIFSGAVEIFAKANSESVRMTRHEFGHLIASQIGGSVQPPQKYIHRAERDRSGVSEYGNNNWAEDFAEGIEAYLRTNAGRLDLRLRADLQKRFAFFDDIFSDRSPQAVAQFSQPFAGRVQKPFVFVQLIDRSHILAIAPELGAGILLDLN